MRGTFREKRAAGPFFMLAGGARIPDAADGAHAAIGN